MFNINIADAATKNSYFRQEQITGAHSQIVLMSLKPGEDIGMEVHTVDQILYFVEGTGKAIIDGEESDFGTGHIVFVPAGGHHNFINTGLTEMKLFTIYAPAEHAPGTVHKTKAEAEAAEKAEHQS